MDDIFTGLYFFFEYVMKLFFNALHNVNATRLKANNYSFTKVVVGFNEFVAKSFKRQFKVLLIKDDLLFHRSKDKAILGFTNVLFPKGRIKI